MKAEGVVRSALHFPEDVSPHRGESGGEARLVIHLFRQTIRKICCHPYRTRGAVAKAMAAQEGMSDSPTLS